MNFAPKIIKKPLRINPFWKQICKRTPFQFFEASLFSIFAVNGEVFMGEPSKDMWTTHLLLTSYTGSGQFLHLAPQSSNSTWASCGPLCRTFPWGGCSTGQPLLTAGKKFSIPSCEVRFLPKWSIWLGKEWERKIPMEIKKPNRWERKIPMKIKKPLPAQNQWTNQSTKTQKNYVAWTFSGCFFYFFFEKILDWEIWDTEGKMMTISLSSRHL